MTDSGRYMYAVCRGLDPAAVAEVRGLRDGSLAIVAHDDLMAVVSSVPLDEFDEEGLKVHLEDLDWLEETARRHDAVVQALAAAAPTAPLRLATICLDDDGVRRRLVEWHVALQQILDRIEGRSEWSVKVFADDRVPTAKPPEPPVSSGAEYLQRKKAAATAQMEDRSSALEVADRVHESLARLSVASRRLPEQDPRLTGHKGTMLLNGAYLVDTDGGDRLIARIDELAAEHPEVAIDCRGPWPPYSFAMLAQ